MNMTKFLESFITDQTPVLLLSTNDDISNKEKSHILDLESCLSQIYIRKMYYQNLKWYYFKEDSDNYGYPFYMIDELMGSYLAKKRNLPTVSYQIAQADVSIKNTLKSTYGIASANFKKTQYNYCLLSQLQDGYFLGGDMSNIPFLKNCCVSEENTERLLNHLFQLFALDIYMIQRDRSNVNLQFQIDKETGDFDIAPLYDFSNCSSKIESGQLMGIKNIIVDLTYLNILSIGRKYPEFKEELLFWLDQNIMDTWKQICEDYHFNQNCSAYERVQDYYKIKEESTKKYIKQMIKDIQK